ncbi:PTPRS phosphatase, partial [Polypterus senegalus]
MPIKHILRSNKQMSILVSAVPIFTKVPVDQIGVSGGVASFVCQATGDPKPRVSWIKKGKRVNSQRVETIDFDEGAGAVLRIQPLRTPRDENTYECVAENSEGNAVTTAQTLHPQRNLEKRDVRPPKKSHKANQDPDSAVQERLTHKPASLQLPPGHGLNGPKNGELAFKVL